MCKFKWRVLDICGTLHEWLLRLAEMINLVSQKVRRKAAMPKLAPPFFSRGHVYFVMISGPINVLGKTVEIHGT